MAADYTLILDSISSGPSSLGSVVYEDLSPYSFEAITFEKEIEKMGYSSLGGGSGDGGSSRPVSGFLYPRGDN